MNFGDLTVKEMFGPRMSFKAVMALYADAEHRYGVIVETGSGFMYGMRSRLTGGRISWVVPDDSVRLVLRELIGRE